MGEDNQKLALSVNVEVSSSNAIQELLVSLYEKAGELQRARMLLITQANDFRLTDEQVANVYRRGQRHALAIEGLMSLIEAIEVEQLRVLEVDKP